MADTFILIAKTVVGSGGSGSLSFTSIPSTYTDLCLLVSARNTSGGENCSITLNGSSSSFTLKGINGDGSTYSSYSRTDNLNAFLSDGSGNTANTFSSVSVYFPNYASGTYKPYLIDSLTENNAAGATATLQAGLWSDASAISSMSFAAGNGSGTFAQYTSAYLYGIKSS